MRRRTESHENVAILRLEMIAAGSYYWFRAEGPDENLLSALNRLKYCKMAQRFDAMNISKPSPEEIYACAVERWPSHKLHEAPKVSEESANA